MYYHSLLYSYCTSTLCDTIFFLLSSSTVNFASISCLTFKVYPPVGVLSLIITRGYLVSDLLFKSFFVFKVQSFKVSFMMQVEYVPALFVGQMNKTLVGSAG